MDLVIVMAYPDLSKILVTKLKFYYIFFLYLFILKRDSDRGAHDRHQEKDQGCSFWKDAHFCKDARGRDDHGHASK